jgi:hypothetical protein
LIRLFNGNGLGVPFERHRHSLYKSTQWHGRRH